MASINADASAAIDLVNSATGALHNKMEKQRGHEITSKTIKAPPFSYACLELKTEALPSSTDLDEVTVRSYITSALTQFLGITGSAISVDILKIEGAECWVRVPRQDLSPFIAAVGGWTGLTEDGNVGWRIKAKGNWLSSLVTQTAVGKVWSD
ncbi:uncharacterized protein BP5553_07061 [Venustampulla echinocandica]|uniref:Ribonucleases P/MRP subunit Pop8-like domain-containing protein n=1 Tax=Venustampulla echinocandica TaxID=2656787 RepID=A0A370TIG5_9HELO|nr:uncharacterized protein BP5553_07061 [Venustampulla echinocandica]RDL35130.1 hypothetical protein BP5553_07061 [Venustampulla echinocandica]